MHTELMVFLSKDPGKRQKVLDLMERALAGGFLDDEVQRACENQQPLRAVNRLEKLKAMAIQGAVVRSAESSEPVVAALDNPIYLLMKIKEILES